MQSVILQKKLDFLSFSTPSSHRQVNCASASGKNQIKLSEMAADEPTRTHWDFWQTWTAWIVAYDLILKIHNSDSWQLVIRWNLNRFDNDLRAHGARCAAYCTQTQTDEVIHHTFRSSEHFSIAANCEYASRKLKIERFSGKCLFESKRCSNPINVCALCYKFSSY